VAGFRIEDRIVTYYRADPDLRRVFEGWADYIGGETLSTRLIEDQPPSEAYTASFEIEGQKVTLGVVRSAESAESAD